MKEISNSTLALLVIMSIVVSIGATFMSLGKLNQLGGGALTGFLSYNATGIGYANLSVTSSAMLNVTDDSIQLGVLNHSTWKTSDTVTDFWIIKNDGGSNLTVRLGSHAASDQVGSAAGEKFGGRGPFTSTTNLSVESCLYHWGPTVGNWSYSFCFTVYCKNTSSTDGICNSTKDYLPLAADIATSRKIVDDLLPSPDVNDMAWIGVNVTVPPNEASGDKIQWVSFYGTVE